MKNFIVEKLKASWDNAKTVHCYWLKKGEGWMRLIISLIIYGILSYYLFESDPKIGVSFGFAGFMAIYSGVIYKGRNIMGRVLAGVILGMVVSQLLFDAWGNFRHGDWIGFGILLAFALYFWYLSSTMKRGEMPA